MNETHHPANLKVPARTIPVPTTISSQAQAFLENAVQRPEAPDIPPGDATAWQALVDQVNPGLTQMLQHSAIPYPAEIRKHALSNCDIYEVAPATYRPEFREGAIFYAHGGGFTAGHGLAAAYAAQAIASLTGLVTYSLDYRMPPRDPFPAALDDAIEGYQFALARHDASRLAVGGVSAGAGLMASAMLRARDQEFPLPAACVLASPEADMTETGDTFETNATIDVVLKRRLTNSILLYANGHDLTDPYISPIHGDFSRGFPATFLCSGTRDLFLSNTVRFHRALRREGIEAELHVWEAMPHGGFFGAPEDEECYREQARFVLEKLGFA